MRKQTKTFREKLVESSVIIGAIIIFIGFLKQYLYYKHFGIPIHQYLTLDEVLILFLSDLTYFFFILLLVFAYGLIWLVIIRLGVPSESNDKNEADIESFLDELFRTLFNQKEGKPVIISFVLNIISLILFYFFSNTFTIILFSLFSSQTTLFFICWVSDSEINDISILISTFIGLAVLLLCKNQIDIKDTESQFNRTKYAIELKENTIHTSSDTLYLGKTKDYLYLFDNKEKQSIILKVEDLKGIKQTNLK